MKNKESFLKELQSRLSVLEEAEQQDILAEYAQHIDLRVDGGLTEEEAIRDFGDIDQLTAEILSAYHVKPTYQAPKEKKRLPSPWPAVRRGMAGAGAFFRRLGAGIAGGLGRLGERVRSWPARCRGWLNKPLFARPGAETPAAEQEAQGVTEPVEAEAPQVTAEHSENKEEKPVERAEKRKTAWAALGRGFRRLGRGLWRLLRGAAWLAWNLFLLLCALPFAGLGLLALMCLGALAVLLIQGYPLVGVTLCCLGGAACCVGVLGLGSGLIWHRPAMQTAGMSVEEPVTVLAGQAADETEGGEVSENVQL